MADALPFAGPPCLMRPEHAVTCSDASVSDWGVLSVPGKPKGRPASVPIIAISLFNEIGGAFKAPDESHGAV